MTTFTRQEYMLILEAIDLLHKNIEGSLESLHETARQRHLTNTDEFKQERAKWRMELTLLNSIKRKVRIHTNYYNNILKAK